jgi:predicted DNA-binding transcriptional regulator AlpA
MGMCTRSIWPLVRAGQFPEPIRWNRKLVRWHADVVERWLAELCGKVV